MFVCMCLAVTESEVHACIRDGARTVEALSKESLAGTGCGGCLERVEMILEECGVLHLADSGQYALPRSA